MESSEFCDFRIFPVRINEEQNIYAQNGLLFWADTYIINRSSHENYCKNKVRLF